MFDVTFNKNTFCYIMTDYGGTETEEAGPYTDHAWHNHFICTVCQMYHDECLKDICSITFISSTIL